ncbi:putative F-box protein At5g50220 [Rosa rugosa]|uniref:putative F-box protein At5g50220 n=1 Tax=Rosa rugosa TaxID=74645 RepID=UPI002B414790|nr:putative F-box protein At5g50220 [Rosa rugosa]
MEMPTAAMSTSKLMELPHDILLNIFSRLPAASLLQFQCVSKSSRDLVNDPALTAMHMAATNEHVDVEARVLSDSLFRNHFQFVSCGLLGFRCDWSDGKLGLYNPLRGEYLELPLPEDGYSNWYGMGFDSVTSTHKIVHFFSRLHDLNDTKVGNVHVLGTSSWRRIPSVPRFCLISRESAYAYGNMHWLVEGNRIISFDFEKEEFGWTINPPHLNFPSESQLFLINLRGSIALVDVSDENIEVEIWVYKEKKYWAKDYSLNFCCPPEYRYSVGAWQHGIYILIPYANKAPLYFTVVYNDLRCDSVRGTVPNEYWRQREEIRMFSYTGSLISLKKYDNLRTNNKKEKNFFDAGKSELPEFLSELKVPRDRLTI